jgi:hypothetical protein
MEQTISSTSNLYDYGTTATTYPEVKHIKIINSDEVLVAMYYSDENKLYVGKLVFSTLKIKLKAILESSDIYKAFMINEDKFYAVENTNIFNRGMGLSSKNFPSTVPIIHSTQYD